MRRLAEAIAALDEHTTSRVLLAPLIAFFAARDRCFRLTTVDAEKATAEF